MILILEQLIPVNVQAADVVSVMSVADELRYEADGVIYEYNEETKNYEVSKCNTDIRQVIIPDSIRGINVTKIRDHAFEGCNELRWVIMGDNITVVGEFAFDGCSQLENIYISRSLKQLESFAFFGCSSLEEVELPDGTTDIGGFSFYHCGGMKRIKIPASVETIGTNAFVHCDALVIYCTVGSVGYQYASNRGIPFSFKSDWNDIPTMEPTTEPTIEPTIEPTVEPTATPKQTPKPTQVPTATPAPKPTVTLVVTKTPAYTIYFRSNGGILEIEEKSVTYGETYGELPVPKKEGYRFLGWYTSMNEDGVRITEDTVVNLSSAQMLFARWEGKTFQVSFDGNGGTLEGGAINVIYDMVYGSLPTAKKEGETFLGWYTKKEDGTHITSDSIYKLDENQILYAHWVKKNKGVKLEDLSFSFGNSHDAFSYENGYVIPLSTYQQIFGDTEFANMQYGEGDTSGKGKPWFGNCFGMCSAAIMLFAGDTDVQFKDFNGVADYNSELVVTDQSQKIQMTLTKLIESLQVVQRDPITTNEKNKHGNQLGLLYDTIEKNNEDGLFPVIIYLYGSIENNGQGGACSRWISNGRE